LFGAGQGLDGASGGRIVKALKEARFTGAAGQAVDIFAPDGVDYERVIVVGVGKPDAADGMAVERWAGAAVKRMLTGGAEKIALMPDALPGVAAAEVAAHATNWLTDERERQRLISRLVELKQHVASGGATETAAAYIVRTLAPAASTIVPLRKAS
jgi:leucyl aminopeptidase